MPYFVIINLFYITVILSLNLRNSVTYLLILFLLFRFFWNNIVTIRSTVKTDLPPFVFFVCIRHLHDDGSSGQPNHGALYIKRQIY